MITEDYVSFEVAKLLKEKGFDVYCPLWYNLDKPTEGPFFYKEIGWFGHNSYDYNGKRIVSAPTLQMAMKWLREVHHIHIEIHLDSMDGIYPIYEALYSECVTIRTDNFIDYRDTYEQACDTAIKYCLENLI